MESKEKGPLMPEEYCSFALRLVEKGGGGEITGKSNRRTRGPLKAQKTEERDAEPGGVWTLCSELKVP